jgi:hypothetical protein
MMLWRRARMHYLVGRALWHNDLRRILNVARLLLSYLQVNYMVWRARQRVLCDAIIIIF